MLTIKATIAGDFGIKFMYDMIDQRNSGKRMLMATEAAAFVDLVDYGKSADNLLGNDNKQDEANKCMWLANAAIKGARRLANVV